MSEKFQPGEETFDDVTGHAIRSGRALPEETDGTEGHGFRGNAVSDDGDIEGHMARSGRALPSEEDTEGHGIRVRFSQSSEVTEDDTEGHASSNRALPDEETEGHGVRVRVALPADDETEGHARSGRMMPEETSSVEGHGVRSGRLAPGEGPAGTEGTEGHMARSGRALPSDEDTEGHAVKPPKPERSQGDEGDDTEGHMSRGRG